MHPGECDNPPECIHMITDWTGNPVFDGCGFWMPKFFPWVPTPHLISGYLPHTTGATPLMLVVVPACSCNVNHGFMIS